MHNVHLKGQVILEVLIPNQNEAWLDPLLHCWFYLLRQNVQLPGKVGKACGDSSPRFLREEDLVAFNGVADIYTHAKECV